MNLKLNTMEIIKKISFDDTSLLTNDRIARDKVKRHIFRLIGKNFKIGDVNLALPEIEGKDDDKPSFIFSLIHCSRRCTGVYTAFSGIFRIFDGEVETRPVVIKKEYELTGRQNQPVKVQAFYDMLVRI